eukprot:2701808-Rhodomonas_salina.6
MAAEVLRKRMVLCSGTEIAYGALLSAYARATRCPRCPVLAYSYVPTRCPVLSCGMLLPGRVHLGLGGPRAEGQDG